MTGGGVESIVASGDALLCTEAFGSREHPAVLLIMGPDGVDAVVAGRVVRAPGERRALRGSLEDARQLAGTRHPFDEAAARALVERDLARTARPESLVNHALLAAVSRSAPRPARASRRCSSSTARRIRCCRIRMASRWRDRWRAPTSRPSTAAGTSCTTKTSI